MTKTLADFLQDSLEKNKIESRKAKQRLRLYSILRVLSFLMAISFFYSYVGHPQEGYLVYLSLLCLILFFVFLGLYLDLKSHYQYLGYLRIELDDEGAYLEKQELRRKPFQIKGLSAHPYAEDLNLFGTNSLHLHLDRSFDERGAEHLGRLLLNLEPNGIREKQEFYEELGQEREQNFHIRALGHQVKASKELYQKLKNWEAISFSAFPNWYYPLMALGTLAALYFLFQLFFAFDAQTFQKLTYAAGFNLLLLLSRIKVIRQQQYLIGEINSSMQAYAAIIGELESFDFKSTLGQSFLKNLMKDGKASTEIKRLASYLASLDQMSNAVVLMVVNGLFPYHLLRFKALEKWHKGQVVNLAHWLNLIKEFEAHLSLANYVDVHSDFNWPEPSANLDFEAEDLAHPLMPPKSAVGNSISMAQSKLLILTGSNMSGKSTFLRTVGLNLLLFQMGLKVRAKHFKAYPFQLLSSMSPNDDLNENRSYFQAEILRLRQLTQAMNPERYSFLIMDEILRGTNSADKKSGTRNFLLRLRKDPTLGILATHDIEIADLAEEDEHFGAYFFESRVEQKELMFDYILRPGVCRTPNANLLMRRYDLFDENLEDNE